MLSFLAERDANAYVPGITNIIEGGYQQKDGTIALSVTPHIAFASEESMIMRAEIVFSSLDHWLEGKQVNIIL